MLTRRHFLVVQAATPYLDRRGAPARPGELPATGAEDLDYIPVGLFGPDDPRHPAGGTVYMGVALAVERANAGLGRDGKPFRLFSRWSDDPWRAGASAVTKLAFEDRIVALVGGIDSATTHLAEQVAAKALFPMVDPVSTDETANAAFVPWIFSWAPGDSLLARAIADAIGRRRYTLLAATDHGSRQLARVLSRLAQPAERHDFQPRTGRLCPLIPWLSFSLRPGRCAASWRSSLRTPRSSAGLRCGRGPAAASSGGPFARRFSPSRIRRCSAPLRPASRFRATCFSSSPMSLRPSC